MKNKKKDMYQLTSTIENPGQEFLVGEDLKDTTFLPNSLIRSSFILGIDESNPNIGFHQAVMFRRGKGGKPSLKVGTLLAPIYNIKELDLKQLYPNMEERKYFVLLEESDSPTENIINVDHSKYEDLEEFIRLYAWLLTKAKFLKALDTKSQAAEHATAEVLGPSIVNRPKVINKHEQIKRILSTMEESINHESPADVYQRFINAGKLDATIREIRSAEHMLAIPKNYYIKSIYGLMHNSLRYLKDHISKSDIESKDVILKSIIEEKKRVIDTKYSREKTTNKRLKNIKDNQIKLNTEDIF